MHLFKFYKSLCGSGLDIFLTTQCQKKKLKEKKCLQEKKNGINTLRNKNNNKKGCGKNSFRKNTDIFHF